MACAMYFNSLWYCINLIESTYGFYYVYITIKRTVAKNFKLYLWNIEIIYCLKSEIYCFYVLCTVSINGTVQ